MYCTFKENNVKIIQADIHKLASCIAYFIVCLECLFGRLIINHETRIFNRTDTSDYIAPYSLFTSENTSLAHKESSFILAMHYNLLHSYRCVREYSCVLLTNKEKEMDDPVL